MSLKFQAAFLVEGREGTGGETIYCICPHFRLLHDPGKSKAQADALSNLLLSHLKEISSPVKVETPISGSRECREV